jgi:tetratricopeptide (TPR) repeat protein
MSDLNGALEIARSSRDHNAEAMAHTGLSVIQLVAGDYEEGIASARKALAVAEKTGDAMYRYAASSFLAWGTVRLGKAAESLPHWAVAHEAAKLLGGRLLMGEWFAAFEAEALVESGDPAAGFCRAEEGISLSRSGGSVIGEALNECALGRALMAMPSRLNEAREHLKRASELFESIGAKYDLARSFLEEGKALLACDDRAGASATLQKAATLAHECQLEREESTARELMAGLGPA